MHLIYHDGSAGGIFFPPGKPKDGGTCEFATRKCLNNCVLKVNEPTKQTYRCFVDYSVGEIVGEIMREMSYYPNKFITWFVSGDCPRELEDKIAEVMKCLSRQEIVQHGFTRNKSLWRKIRGIHKLTLCLTVENLTKASKEKEGDYIVVPDYKTERVDIFKLKDSEYTYSGSCGSGWVKTPVTQSWDAFDVSEEDCGLCYKNKKGCFGL
ncbi:MAG: hypothetical protein KAS32_13840 [Candidatus Peribacteraceae bacterium]|nr:hypothetical protein [Candidatus Peribacteraceae bacterium]